MNQKKRQKLKFTEIEKFSQPIKLPDRYLITGEIGFSRYCMDKILKEYANFSLDKKIHALFEHGVQITEYCKVFLGHINMSQVLYPQNIVLKY